MSPVIRPTVTLGVCLLVASCTPVDEESELGLQPEHARPPIVWSPLDPSEPSKLGQAPSTASTTQHQALWWVNTYRQRAGLGAVDELGSLNDAAAAHANYVLVNPDVYDVLGLSVHEEIEGRDAFFGERFWDRMDRAGYEGTAFREVIAYQAHPEAAVAHWMETVYHRLPILSLAARHVGYSEAHLGVARINVLDIGAGSELAPESPAGVVWPPDGATNIPVSWDGLESPQPPTPPNGYPSGPVITLSFGLDLSLQVLSHSIIRYGNSTAIPHMFLTPSNDENLTHENAVAMYTHSPLQPGVTYQVAITAIVDGTKTERKWVFTTRTTEGCHLLEQDCGVGKACYGSNDADAVCSWSGAQHEGSSCDFQNDCRPGLTCVGQRCQAYCRLLEGVAGACGAVCGNGYTSINSNSALGVCTP